MSREGQMEFMFGASKGGGEGVEENMRKNPVHGKSLQSEPQKSHPEPVPVELR